ncbi:MAG: nuclear transport factor 2 family protein [Calditrichaceae bacterium]|jgi:hypothetical protein
MTDKKNISKIIESLNQNMIKGDLSKLDLYFHENVRIIAPDLKILGDGRKICIQSYHDFINKAEIKDYNDSVDNVFIYENTAIVFYTFTMTWIMDGKANTEKGQELYVLTRQNDQWLIILRKLISADT